MRSTYVLASLLLLLIFSFLSNEAQGINSKLLTMTSPSRSPSITRNEEGERKANPMSKEIKLSVNKEKDSGNSQPSSENLEAGLEHYPDLLDIAGMDQDYSPVKTKRPVNN